MTFWNRRQDSFLIESQYSVQSPSPFSVSQIILYSLVAILIVALLGVAGISALFLDGVEEAVATSPVRITIDSEILRD